jgi:long-chain acyl-CoA synthetase
MPESIAEFFLEHFKAHARETAYRQRRGYRSQTFTYGDVLKLACGLARTLGERGIRKGDRVMLWGENCAEWVAAFFGCALGGVIAVPMDDGAAGDFALRVFQQSQAKLLVASKRHLQAWAAGETIATLPLEDIARIANDAAPISRLALSRDDLLQIVFTSGTTAEPRGVAITHGNVLANIAPLEKEMQRYLRYERWVHPLRFLNLLPLSHVFGQFLGMFLPPLLGGTVIFQNELKPSEIVRTVRRDRVSVLVCVPRVLQSLKQKMERDVADRGRIAHFKRRFASSEKKHFLRRWWIFRDIRREFGWKFLAFICGGAALDRETEEFWHRLGYAVIQGYGLTETTSLVSVNHPFRLGRGSIGKVLPGREVKLADDGEILVRGGGVASGVWDGSGTRVVVDEQGWYRTGDIGALDEAGNLYFKGRKKEVMVTPGGTNVYPEDLEAALRRQPEVRDCVVVAMERDGNAEPCATLILREGSDAAKVVARANESLAEYQRMRMWVEWPEQDFPRTNTQKPRRNLIAQTARERLLGKSPLFAQTAREKWGTQSGPLAELIAKISGRTYLPLSGALRADTALDSDLGMSSLDRVELLGALEDRYQIDLSETRFSALRTVGDLERLLRGDAAPGRELQRSFHYPSWVLRWPVTWLRFLAQYLLMRPAILLLGWPRIEGREHLRGARGPLLVVCNHIGDIDPGFVLTALPARFRHRLAIATGGEALEALRTPPASRGLFLRIYDRIRWVLGVSLLNLFPLPREGGFRRSFAYAGEAVERGYSLLIFPEGRHTTDGTMLPFRAGIGLLAESLCIPVVPMRIDGLFEFKSAGKKFAPPWKIGVKIGAPRRFETGSDPGRIAEELQKAVAEL